MTTTEVGRITPGLTYEHHELKHVRKEDGVVVEDINLGPYRVEGFAYDGLTRRDVVVCQGLEGAARGKLFVFSLADFCTRFRPPAEPKESP